MFDKADDELIERLIKEAETIIKEELQKNWLMSWVLILKI